MRGTPTSAASARTSAAGIIWICAVQFFAAQIIVQAGWTTPFSLYTNYISDLGNTACTNYPAGARTYVCSPWHLWMNVSFVLQGVIIIVGSMLFSPLLRGGAAKFFVLTLLVLTGIAILGVGIFPENLNNEAHLYSAGLQFITGNLALIIIGATKIVSGSSRQFLIASVLLGIIGLAATGLFVTGIHFGLGVGGMERVAAYTFPIWLIGAGAWLVMQGCKQTTEWRK